jgi:hypothetical protein
MKELTIRLDEQTYIDLWAMARRYGITMEEAARRCIKYVLSEVENPEADPANDPTVRKLLSWILPAMRGDEKE